MARIRVKKSPSNPAVPNQTAPGFDSSRMQKPSFETGRTLKAVPREDANIEAESGETALIPNKNGLPAHFNIRGNRHSQGGTPLNVPKDTFIFSDTKKMRIKDPEILAEFGKSKGSYTPADLAKKYDLNKYRKLLQDPDSDKLQVETAEKMIENYNLKLAKLALVQESKKGFPQGIPAVAMPFLATYNVQPDQILPLQGEQQPQEQGAPQMRFGGPLPKAQNGRVSPDSIVSDFYKDQAKQLAAQDAAVKKRLAELQSKEATERVRKELSALYEKQGIIRSQKMMLEKNLNRATSQLYPHLEEQPMLAQWLRIKPDVITPDLSHSVPTYQKAKAKYDAFLKEHPDLIPNKGEPSNGNMYRPYDKYADLVETPPPGGFPGFSPYRPQTVKVKVTPPGAKQSTPAVDSSMEAEIKNLMTSEKLTREEALYVLTGK